MSLLIYRNLLILINTDAFLNIYNQIRSRDEATKPTITNIINWLKDHDRAIDQEESSFIYESPSDLIPVVEIPRSPLRRLLEKLRTFDRYSGSRIR